MGINLALILEHSLTPAGVVAFRERASANVNMRRSASQLWEVMRPRWPGLRDIDTFAEVAPDEDLSDDEILTAWDRGEVPRYEWAGFFLYFERRVVIAISYEKLVGFVLDLDHLREPLLACARALAGELRSPVIVYGPDCFSPFQYALDWFTGQSLAERLSIARLHCGDPAPSVRDMVDANERLKLDENCYYVEAVELGLDAR